jgi:hypothetical protein
MAAGVTDARDARVIVSLIPRQDRASSAVHWVRISGADGQPKNIVRDYRGQPLLPDFMMSAKHRVQLLNWQLTPHAET